MCFLILISFACNHSQVNDSKDMNNEITQLRQELNAVRKEIDSIKSLQPTAVSPLVDTIQTAPRESKENTKQIIAKKQETEIKPSINKNLKPNTDTVFYRFTDGRVSVKVCPFIQNERTILIFNPFGEIVYTLTDTRKSYSVTNQLKFRANGSIQEVRQRTNPDAGRFWSECMITFSEENNPQRKHCNQMPAETLLDAMGKVYYWDKAKKSWIAQKSL